MIDLKDCSREDLIRVIAKMKDGISSFSSHNTGYDNNTCELLNRIGTQAIEKCCDTIGWNIKEKSKLEWEQNPPKEPMSWDDAVKYSDSLNTMREYGWRLPTKEELLDAYSDEIQGFKPFYYWSSTTHALFTNFAWYVCFQKDYLYGYANFYSKDYNYYVRCVREVK